MLQSATDQKCVSEAVPRLMALTSDLFLSVRIYEWICIARYAHTGFFCAHVVGSVTVVELSFVTLIRPESELFEGVLETEDDFPATAASFVVECTLAVRDDLLVVAALADGFNGLDAGFLPDERSAKRTVYCRNVVCVYHERLAVCWTCKRRLFKLRSQTGLFSLPCQSSASRFALSAHRPPCLSSSPFSNHWPTSHCLLFSYDRSLPLRQLDVIIPAWLYTLEHSLQ